MTELYCLNLCEVIEDLYEKYGSIDNIVSCVKGQQGIPYYTRIYIGSNFCSHYFLNLSKSLLEELTEYTRKTAIKLTLTLPVFTEDNLEKAKKCIARYVETLGDGLDEVTANDYGMLAYMASKYPNIRLNMGRLFMKDYRDPRYKEHFKTTLSPKIFTKYLDELIKTYNIKGIEFDPVHEEMTFKEKPEYIEIGIHEPYCYMTVGQICEFASIHKPISEKFRPNSVCERECTSNKIKYYLHDEREWIRLGRTIYFKNKPRVSGVEKIRRIYFPIDMEEK